jgi:hypothetical protein
MAETIDRLRALKAKIKDCWSLCGFMQKFERDCLVFETIHASVNNFDKYGVAFSFRGNSVFAFYGNGLIDNASAYDYLVREGHFIESQRREKPIIIPSEKLLTALEEFFAKKEVRS